ncbi:SDR family oxidoreductase [Actinoplanes sp. ATCC 53533]|uniref:SDR family oxidoreductase n=1 Tax=Actinoplanes sp. ATCC 53533 TaxID=1288362 RepID=UPI001F331C55|nr:NAD(P)H-binding protein [Actinoplanes sp. ATCC 53533]
MTVVGGPRLLDAAQVAGTPLRQGREQRATWAARWWPSWPRRANGVTAVSRRPAPIPAGVRHVPADLSDADSLRPALDGAEALFVLLAGGGTEVDPDAVLGTAKAAGVRRVLLSSQGVRTRPGAASHAHLGAFEAAVRGSGLEWTILRSGGFATNAYAWAAAAAAAAATRERRLVAAPFADVALPVIDPADLAACAAVTLRENHHTQVYKLTGPAAISPRNQAAALGAALGEEVTFVELTRTEAAAAMGAFMPPEVVAGTLDILGTPTPDEQLVSADVARLLGRGPCPFAAWAADHVAAFR